jgi:rhodanese-related sulfurtransferase
MKSKSPNRRTIIILAVLTIILGSIAWISASNLDTQTPVIAQPQLIDPHSYSEQFGDGVEHVLVDVRTPEEYNSGHIAGSVNINVETIADRLDEIPSDVPVVLYCRSGNRSATAADILVRAGYEEVYDLGGIQAWVAEGYPIQ